MKFRLLTDAANGRKIAVNIDYVRYIEARKDGTTVVALSRHDEFETMVIEVSEPFDVVFSRLNTIAE